MTKKWKRTAAIMLISACLAGGTAWADSQTSPEAEAVKEAFIGSQDIMYKKGLFQSDTGKTDTLTEEEVQSYIDEYNAQIDRYYAEGNICRQTYKETNEHLFREVCANEVYYKVDAGVLDCTFQNVSISEDGQEATVKAVYTSWGNWVEENEDGQLRVTAPIGEDTITATMVKEDGLWKLGKIDEMHAEFAADAIYELEEQNGGISAMAVDADTQEKVDAIEEYQEKTYFTQYESFDEALAVAKSIDPTEVNPFVLKWRNR